MELDKHFFGLDVSEVNKKIDQYIKSDEIVCALKMINHYEEKYGLNPWFMIQKAIAMILIGDLNTASEIIRKVDFDVPSRKEIEVRLKSSLLLNKGDTDDAHDLLISYYLESNEDIVNDSNISLWKNRLKVITKNRVVCNSTLSSWQSNDYNSYTNWNALENSIMYAVNRAEPFSFVRLGDAEGCVMAKCNRTLGGTVFNAAGEKHLISPNEMDMIVDKLLLACEESDVLGLARHDMRNDYYKFSITMLTQNTMNKISDSKITVTDCHAHYPLYLSGLFEKIIAQCSFIGFVGGRNIKGYIDSFGDKTFVWHRIPAEKEYSELLQESHYPYYYKEVMTDLKVPFKGAVYFVGAGVLGKIYANEIKRQGGIAIDIGAIADLWAGKKETRKFIIANNITT